MLSKRVLVVDDEPGVRFSLSANLELEGFEVAEAESVDDALEALAAGPFDVVLSDIRMPGRSGIDLCHVVRHRHPGVPVVLMTAFTEEAQLHVAVESGVFTVLPKPFQITRAAKVLEAATRAPVVLIVDDHEPDAQSLAELLASMGVRSVAVSSGAHALETVDARTVDVCITDLVMPDMSGLELFEQLRTRDVTVRVVVFTGHNVPDMMRQAASSGAALCLRKPLDPSRLVRTIANLRADP